MFTFSASKIMTQRDLLQAWGGEGGKRGFGALFVILPHLTSKEHTALNSPWMLSIIKSLSSLFFDVAFCFGKLLSFFAVRTRKNVSIIALVGLWLHFSDSFKCVLKWVLSLGPLANRPKLDLWHAFLLSIQASPWWALWYDGPLWHRVQPRRLGLILPTPSFGLFWCLVFGPA